MRTGRWLAFATLAAVVGCNDSGPKFSLLPTPQPTALPTPAATPTPTPRPTPAPTPTPTPGPNSPPAGEFRYTPMLDPDGGLHLGIAETVRVNAGRFRDPDGDALYLTVHWGDGSSNHIACGLCRLEHQYLKFGRFELVAEVTDLVTRPVQQTVDVVVQ